MAGFVFIVDIVDDEVQTLDSIVFPKTVSFVLEGN